MRLEVGSLWGNYGLRTASEIKLDLRFEFSNSVIPNNYSHEHIASKDLSWPLGPIGPPYSLGGLV